MNFQLADSFSISDQKELFITKRWDFGPCMLLFTDVGGGEISITYYSRDNRGRLTDPPDMRINARGDIAEDGDPWFRYYNYITKKIPGYVYPTKPTMYTAVVYPSFDSGGHLTLTKAGRCGGLHCRRFQDGHSLKCYDVRTNSALNPDGDMRSMQATQPAYALAFALACNYFFQRTHVCEIVLVAPRVKMIDRTIYVSDSDDEDFERDRVQCISTGKYSKYLTLQSDGNVRFFHLSGPRLKITRAHWEDENGDLNPEKVIHEKKTLRGYVNAMIRETQDLVNQKKFLDHIRRNDLSNVTSNGMRVFPPAVMKLVCSYFVSPLNVDLLEKLRSKIPKRFE